MAAVRSASPADPVRRQSYVSTLSSAVSTSSVTSFRTAPIATPSASASSSRSSLNTLGQENNVNPIHTLSQAIQQQPHQEVHILKVSADKVQVEATSLPDSLLKLVNTPPRVQGGQLPPSPPASIIGDDEKRVPEKPSQQTVLYDEPEPYEPRERVASTSSAATARIIPIRSSTFAHVPQEGILQRSSTETKSSSLSTARPDQLPEPRAADLLHPPTISISKPTRRNTTGSSLGSRMSRGARGSMHGQSGSQPHGYEETPLDDMASDIQLAAEQIRRERMEKRAQQQQLAEAEARLTRKDSRKTDDVPLVGNLIGEGHANYVLMYNMLTGIRIGVSRCQAKIKRPLTDEDFTARHKFSFDIIGNELTPSAKYDFKFKDYAPWIFRSLREDYFHLDPADYLLSLTSKYILSELGSPGKSGSFFYFSRDYRFIIKTIHHSEHKFLLRVLKDYYNHVKENPHTLISRFYGLHRVKLPRGRKIHFVIMNNLFPPHKDVHETYDLKGSTVGREYPEAQAKGKDNPVLKDINWINRGKTLELGPEKRALLTEQLRRDKEMLKRIHVMDYSLLVGIHNMSRGNRDNVRRNTLKVFDPEIPRRHRSQPISPKSTTEVVAVRRAMRESDPKRFVKESLQLPDQDTGERQHFLFYQDEGGLRATDEGNEGLDTIYYLGVIDILTPYNVKKKVEHLWKGLSADRHKISPVPPAEYADRFFSFIKAVMRGGGGGEAFKP